jgi:hypothetical protein
MDLVASSRQLRCYILPVADMETTSYIRRLLAPGAVWDIDLNDCPGGNAFLIHAMRRDECRFPLDACPTLGAVHVLIPVFEAGAHQEQSLVRYEIINADMMWCLQFVLTFHRSDSVRRLARHGEGGRP